MNFSKKNHEHLNKNRRYVSKTTIKILAIGLFAFALTLESCEKEILVPDSEKNQLEETNLIGKKKLNKSEPVFSLESKRHKMGGFADHEMALFKGKVWSVGGDNSNSPPFTSSSDIWSSNDGVNWNFVDSNLFPARNNHSLLVYKKKLWVIGGMDASGNALNDIWNTSNGVDWHRVSRFTPISILSKNSSVVFNDRIYVFSGDSEVTTKVWSSSDGASWRLETSNAYPVRNYTRTIVFNDHIYVVGGWDRDSGRYSNDVWASYDGINWHKNTPGPSSYPGQERIFSPRIEHTMTEYNGKVWVIGGMDQDSKFSNEIWSTTNMKYWKKHTTLPKAASLSHHASLQFKNSLWIFGGYHQASDRSAVLSSHIWSMSE